MLIIFNKAMTHKQIDRFTKQGLSTISIEQLFEDDNSSSSDNEDHGVECAGGSSSAYNHDE